MGSALRQFASSSPQQAGVEPTEISSPDSPQGSLPEEAPDQNPETSSRLRVSFRKRDGIALIVSNVVGVGIFITPAIIANLVPNPVAMLALWIVGGCLALAGASSYADLARLWPSAGGEYVYLSKIYGPAAGFLSGWTSLIAGFSGSVAASAVAVVLYAGQYWPGFAADRALTSLNLFGLTLGLSPRSLTAALLIAIFAAVHICSLTAGRFTQRALALLVTAMVAVFAVRGFAFGHGSWSHFHSSAHTGAMNWLLALIPVMFTYSGWNAPAYVSEEMHGRARIMRPVLLLGTAIVIGIYLLLNTLYLYAIPVSQMSAAANVADAAARALFGTGRDFITPILIVALLGAISAMTIAGPRVYFAMARDGAFIPAFARSSKRFGTPALAIALQALWSIVLVMVGGFDQILMYTGFAIVLSSGAAVAGLFLARRRGVNSGFENAARLIVPGAFVVASGAMLISTLLQDPRVAIAGVLLIAAGLPIYFWCRRNRPADVAVPSPVVAAEQESS